jgi:hypothetical protein
MAEGHMNGYLMVDIVYEDRLNPGVVHKTQITLKTNGVSYRPRQFVEFHRMAPIAGDAPLSTSPGVPNTSMPPETIREPIPAQVIIGWINVGQHNCADEECDAIKQP